MKLILGTRGSKLAIAQAQIIAELLKSTGTETVIRTIDTTGDKNRKRTIEELGGKGVFIKEVENELLASRIDIAVHSLKDLPSKPTRGLVIGAFLPPEDQRDVLVSKGRLKLDELHAGAIIGTSSPRRRLQLKRLRADINVKAIRGNVDTRLCKVDRGDYDAAIVSYAALKRLHLEYLASQIFSSDEIIPAPGQGVLAVQIRANDKKADEIIAKIDDPLQRTISTIEFGILRELGARCDTPIGMNSHIKDKQACLHLFLSDDIGFNYIRKEFTTTTGDENSVIQAFIKAIRTEWRKITGRALKLS